jgi:hypothetical protein
MTLKGHNVNEIQTGSHGEETPDPWERFARHGAIDERPSWAGGRGRRRRPAARVTWRGMLATVGITALAVGSCGTPAPAAVVAPAPVVSDWSTPVPHVTPAAQRRIEVVDRIGPASWKVGAAAGWLDRYTASDMVMVPRCSGNAWRCITVRGGKLGGRTVGYARGNTIVIDTAKMARSPYRSAVHRKRLLVHELAHTFGLHHARGHNLMAPSVDRIRLNLTAAQRAHLRAR